MPRPKPSRWKSSSWQKPRSTDGAAAGRPERTTGELGALHPSSLAGRAAADDGLCSFQTLKRLGFVGLGTMGGNIARRLLDTGYVVTGYNRTRAKAESLIEAGMSWADSPREVAGQSDICFSMVSDTVALEAVTRGPDGIIAGLTNGAVYVDMSTVSPALVRALAKEVEAVGASMLDAPVSGSVALIHSGHLSIMVGGKPETLKAVLPVLLDIGQKVTHVGSHGMGTMMKVATNLQVYVQTLAFAESLRLTELGGIDKAKAMEVMLNSVIASPMLAYRAPFMLDRPAKPWFTVTLSYKDLELALEEAKRFGIQLPTTRAASDMFALAIREGLGSQEAAAVYDVIRVETSDSA